MAGSRGSARMRTARPRSGWSLMRRVSVLGREAAEPRSLYIWRGWVMTAVCGPAIRRSSRPCASGARTPGPLAGVMLPESLIVTHDRTASPAAISWCRRSGPRHQCGDPRTRGGPHRRRRHHRQRAEGSGPRTLLSMSEVVAQELGPGRPVVVLSGPSFAMKSPANSRQRC